MTQEFKVSEFIDLNKKIISCKPSDSIKRAKTIMLMNDFSQLPVISNDDKIVGFISWRSIGKIEALGNGQSIVKGFTEEPKIIKETDNFLDHIQSIAENEFVIVESNSKRLRGIITTYDMTIYFNDFIMPYLRLGIIEDNLRKIIATRIKPKVAKDVNRMTFYEYQQIFKEDNNWNSLGLENLDKESFVQKIDDIRQLRNRIAHYKPNPISNTELYFIVSFSKLLENLTR